MAIRHSFQTGPSSPLSARHERLAEACLAGSPFSIVRGCHTSSPARPILVSATFRPSRADSFGNSLHLRRWYRELCRHYLSVMDALLEAESLLSQGGGEADAIARWMHDIDGEWVACWQERLRVHEKQWRRMQPGWLKRAPAVLTFFFKGPAYGYEHWKLLVILARRRMIIRMDHALPAATHQHTGRRL